MKKLFIFIVFMLTNPVLRAENISSSTWTNAMSLSFTLNQSKARYSSYGPMATKETINLGFLLYGEFIRDTLKSNWKNLLKIEYARSRYYDDSSFISKKQWIEDKDQLLIDSVFRWKYRKYINPYAAENFDTCIINIDYPYEWGAFEPVQLRESGGLSIPVVSRNGHELTSRTGFFIQHYINSPGNIDEPFNGAEMVIEYTGPLNKDSLITSKLGLYSNSGELEDTDGTIEKRIFVQLESDSTMFLSITKILGINMELNVFNIDITDSDANYEWEQKINLLIKFNII